MSDLRTLPVLVSTSGAARKKRRFDAKKSYNVVQEDEGSFPAQRRRRKKVGHLWDADVLL